MIIPCSKDPQRQQLEHVGIWETRLDDISGGDGLVSWENGRSEMGRHPRTVHVYNIRPRKAQSPEEEDDMDCVYPPALRFPKTHWS